MVYSSELSSLHASSVAADTITQVAVLCQVGLTAISRAGTVDRMNSETFSGWLEDRLADRRLSPTEFARRVGVSTTAVFNWLGGKQPKADSCGKIAEVLGVPLLDVLIAAGHVPETARQIDLSTVDIYAAIRAQRSPSEAERMIQILNALDAADRRLKELGLDQLTSQNRHNGE